MTGSETPGTETPIVSPTRHVAAYVAAWNSHDGAAVVDSLAPGATYVDPLLPGPVSGEGLASDVAALAAAVPDLTFLEEETIVEADRVALAWLVTGSYTGSALPGLPGPTGAACQLHGVDLIDVGPEGIRSVVGHFDQLAMLRQLGVDVQIPG